MVLGKAAWETNIVSQLANYKNTDIVVEKDVEKGNRVCIFIGSLHKNGLKSLFKHFSKIESKKQFLHFN